MASHQNTGKDALKRRLKEVNQGAQLTTQSTWVYFGVYTGLDHPVLYRSSSCCCFCPQSFDGSCMAASLKSHSLERSYSTLPAELRPVAFRRGVGGKGFPHFLWSLRPKFIFFSSSWWKQDYLTLYLGGLEHSGIQYNLSTSFQTHLTVLVHFVQFQPHTIAQTKVLPLQILKSALYHPSV